MKKRANKTATLLAACSGEAMSLLRMPDEAFSSGLLGKGFAIEPKEGTILSPVDGKVESVAATRHAYTIMSTEGLEILIHVGVDTVTLGGEGFEALVTEEQEVTAGTPLAKVNPDLIRQRGLSAAVAIVITNPEKIETIEYRFGEVRAGVSPVMSLRIGRKG